MGTRGKARWVPLGIFSSGTLRDEDVGNALADLLRGVALSKEDRQTVREWDAEQNLRNGGLAEWLSSSGSGNLRRSSVDAELCQELWHALDNYLPPYTYAGSSDGDGALFGVWPSIDSLEEDARNDDGVLKVNDLADVPRGFSGYVLSVNDHGNATLHKATRGRLRYVWGVV